MHLKIRRICVPSDFSPTAEQALHYGVAFAREHGAELHLFHVLQDFEEALFHPDLTASGEQARAFFNELEQAEIERAEKDPSMPPILQSIKEDAERRFEQSLKDKWWEGLTVQRTLRYGHPAKEICRFARQRDIDLIVLGTHGRTGLKHLILGSVAERVVRMSPCPVLTVRHPENDFLVED